MRIFRDTQHVISGSGRARAHGRVGAGVVLLVGVCMAWLALVGVAAAATYKAGGYQFDVGAPPAWVAVAAPAATTPAGDGKDAIWRNLLWDRQIDRRHGGHVEYIDYIYQPLTAAVLADASKFQIGFLPDFQSLTIHRVEVLRDGQWSSRLKPEAITLARRETQFESDMATGEVTALLVLDDIRVGDVVRISYTIAGANPVLDGLEADSMSFGSRHPVQRQQLRIWFDHGQAVSIRRDPRIPAERIEDGPAGKRVTLSEDDVPAVSTAGAYPAWFVPAARVVIAPKREWKDIVAWARDLYPAPAPLPDDLLQRVAQWMQSPDPQVRTIHALEAVQDEVRYFGVEIGQNSHRPREPAEVWRRREGDCKDKARLLVTLLARMGISAEPALVSTLGGRWVPDQPPSASPFNHVIVRAHIGGQVVWLDPTRSSQRGTLAAHAVSDLGYALPLANGVDAPVPVTRGEGAIAHWQIDERYIPDADGHRVRMQITTDASGTAAESLRRRLAETDRTTLQNRYRDFYGKRFKNLSVAAPLIIHDDPASNHVTVTESYDLTDPWVSFNGGVRGLDTEADQIEQVTRQPDGQGNCYPVAIGYPIEITQRIALELPQGWNWDGTTMSKSVTAPGMDYSLVAGRKGSEVSFVHSYRSTAPWIDGEQTAHYAEALRQVGDLVSRRFLVDRGSDSTRGDRLHSLVKDLLDGDAATSNDGKGH